MACHIKIFWIYLLEIGWAGFADTVKESGKYLGILRCLGSGNFGFQCGFGFRYFLLLFLHLGQFNCAERGCLCTYVVLWYLGYFESSCLEIFGMTCVYRLRS